MEPEKKINTKYRIGKFIAFIFMSIAIIVDILEFILGITGIGEIIAYIIDILKILFIPISFMLLGVSPVKPSRLKIMSITILVGLIPYVGSFVPEVAIGVRETIKNSRKEDDENIKSGVGVKKDKLITRVKNVSNYTKNTLPDNPKVTRTKRPPTSPSSTS